MRIVLVSALAVGLVVWFLSHANLADVWGEVRRARVDLLAWAFAFGVLSYLARAIRWRYLLAPVGEVSFGSAFRALIIGYAGNLLLPARAGDVVRPYILAKREGLSTTAAFATVVLERVFDLITVVVLLAACVWQLEEYQGGSGSLLRSVQVSATIAGVLSVILATVLVMLARHPERIGHLVWQARRFLPSKWARKLADLATTFSRGLAVTRSPRPLAAAVVWSLPVWVCSAAQIWLGALAFGIDMPFSGSFLQQALVVVGIAVPTPGGIGGFHEAYRFGAMTFFGAPADVAIGSALVLHAVTFIPATILGVAFMAREGVSVRGLRGLTASVKAEPREAENEVPVLRPSGG